MDDSTQQRLGRYEILGELGRGAMGVVYKARDPKINRIVAVKTISLAGQPPEDELDYRERFFREAEAAGRISHPGIVTIFDVGEEAETRAPYIVMEFVSGESLDKLLARNDRKLPMETALQLALELGEALDCAHRQGVVHRDLKPANILMTEDGHAKIADFGVAKLNLANQTLAGRALGTPAYMSPEQLNGESVDGRSDLFSLGVILYTALTGYKPFQGNSAVTVSFKVVNHEPLPATLLDTALPEGLDAIIARAMAKDPADRYQTGMEMVADIQKLRAEPGKAKRASAAAVGRGDSFAAVVATATKSSPVLEPPVPAAPALGLSTPPQPALGPATVSPSSPSRSTSGLAAPSPQGLVAPKLRSGARALPNLKDVIAIIRKKSFVAVAVLAGLFILALWAISLGPQGVQPRAAEPMRPGPAVPALSPAAAGTASASNAFNSAEQTQTDGSKERDRENGKEGDKRAKSTSRHRSDSRSAETASNSKEAPTHRADLHSLKPAHPVVAEVSPVVLPDLAPVVTPVLPTATLEIEVDHKFAEAQLSIWVDDTLSYTHVLEGTEKKRLGVFHHVEGHELHAMQISPGKHRLRVRVTSETPTYDQSAFASSDFTSGQETVLKITINKRGDINLGLQ